MFNLAEAEWLKILFHESAAKCEDLKYEVLVRAGINP